MEVKDFIEAVGASVAGYYICKAVDFVVKSVKDWLNNR